MTNEPWGKMKSQEEIDELLSKKHLQYMELEQKILRMRGKHSFLEVVNSSAIRRLNKLEIEIKTLQWVVGEKP